MRITGGQWRGRNLFAPRGLATRPTTDMLRQALFNILGTRVTGAAWLDLCAGTGAVALEALSRGAASATAVENARPALVALEKNRAATGANIEIMPLEMGRALRTLEMHGARYDFVYLDPPYELSVDAWLAALPPLLNERATVIVERAARGPLPLAPWGEPEVRAYGDSRLALWREIPAGRSE